MKSSLTSALLVLIIIALGAYAFWDHRMQTERNAALQNELIAVNSRLERLEMNMAKTRADMDELGESSLGGMIEDANDALIEGWSAMMNAVGRELETARQTFEKKRQEMEAQKQQEDQSAAGSGDGAL
ncbi:hypothetical protein IB286_09085 [Spongiibacter sp. KMU-158]|uniref:Uncharacterized protein n=1 Tax=Spongiibacter pelagi TaxID=2760804 RepID=A0A927C3M1_9GAMM|nr:hypothetical protein [Spongiibacter pelagi]MBD2859161.1 hypothetical protein [Spongiibacter pelagi]